MSSWKQGAEARRVMHGRLFRCLIGENPIDCPLHEVRLMPVEDRLIWLGSQTDEEVEALFHNHIHCLREKTKSR